MCGSVGFVFPDHVLSLHVSASMSVNRESLERFHFFFLFTVQFPPNVVCVTEKVTRHLGSLTC